MLPVKIQPEGLLPKCGIESVEECADELKQRHTLWMPAQLFQEAEPVVGRRLPLNTSIDGGHSPRVLDVRAF